MTLESTFLAICSAIEDGYLVGYDIDYGIQKPRLRQVYLGPEAAESCPPRGSAILQVLTPKALANARALLTAFVEGEPIFEGQDLKRLESGSPLPFEIWTLRAQENKASACRLFGYFPIRDIFIITHCIMRNKLERKGQWQKQIQKTTRFRDKVLTNLPAMTGDSIHDYISNGEPDYE